MRWLEGLSAILGEEISKVRISPLHFCDRPKGPQIIHAGVRFTKVGAETTRNQQRCVVAGVVARRDDNSQGLRAQLQSRGFPEIQSTEHTYTVTTQRVEGLSSQCCNRRHSPIVALICAAQAITPGQSRQLFFTLGCAWLRHWPAASRQKILVEVCAKRWAKRRTVYIVCAAKATTLVKLASTRKPLAALGCDGG